MGGTYTLASHALSSASGAAGLTSKQVTKQNDDARVFSINSMNNPGGTELADVIYKGETQDPRIFEVGCA